MVRGSELAFRMLAREHGASLCYSPMLRDHDVISVAADPKKFVDKKLKIDNAGRFDSIEETAYLMLHDSHPTDTQNLVVQLCGSCPEKLAEATTAIIDTYASKCEGVLPFGIDLNLGCPQECAQKHGFGAFLDCRAAISCVSSMRAAIDNTSDTEKPLLSAKIRLLPSGVDDTIEFVRKLNSAGADYIAIHCRYRTDKHNGEADWASGAQIVAAVPDLPIVLNGGVSNYDDAQRVMKQTNCHAVMAATGYLRNHCCYGQSPNTSDLGSIALQYLEFAEKYNPPSYLYIQKHLRWIFRDTLQPGPESDPSFDFKNYQDWRVKLWSFLVRPYLRSTEQFKMFVALYVQLSGQNDEKVPVSIRHLVSSVTFGSVKKAGKRKRAEG